MVRFPSTEMIKAMVSPLSNVQGEAVDWWFAYKLPVGVGPKKDTTGFEFLYCDASTGGGPTMSEVTLDHETGALAQTLGSIFSGSPGVGYILWNDEIPPTREVPKPKDDGSKGHTKGILAFDKTTDSGFYLLHSTPRFPGEGENTLPKMEQEYGQTYLCISFKNYETANAIAEVLRTQHEPQVYASKLPGVGSDESLAKLAAMNSAPLPTDYSVIDLETRGGEKLKFFGKNRRWSNPAEGDNYGKDFWEDLVGPELNSSLNVETWRRGMVFSDDDSGGKVVTEDILRVDLDGIGYPGYTWPFTKDHAKWGITIEDDPGAVIVADINRQVTQEHRGGGGLGLQNEAIWNALKAVEVVEKTVEKGAHTDKVSKS